MIVHYARWSDLAPGVHPFDPELARAPLSALVLEAARVEEPDREVLAQEIHRLLLTHHGAWAGGWSWAASEPGGGGPVRGWCCPRDSVLRDDDPGPLATVDRALAALADWRGYLELLTAQFAELRAEAASLSLDAAVERAAARLLPLVLERTGAEDAWYATFTLSLCWFLDDLVGEQDSEHTKELVSKVVSGRFSSWITPDDATARETFTELGAAVASADPPVRDALAEWLRIRPTAFTSLLPHGPAGPVPADGHERFIDEVDRRRDPVRADRMASALVLCRDSARRGMRLTLDQLAEWHAVVVGASSPSEFRTAPAYAKSGRDRYDINPDTQRRFEAALADAHGGPDSHSVAIRAARVYLDVCFFHPFFDANARCARLALDHVLTSSGYALHAAEPVFIVSRGADDRRGAWALAYMLDQLIGPRA